MPETPPPAVYVLHGQDQYLRQQRRQEIVRRFTGDAEVELVVANFDASAEVSDVLDQLRTAPFVAPRRLVIVHDADKFVSANRQALETYLDRPSPRGTLLLLIDSWPPKPKLAKLISRMGEAIDCSPPNESRLPRWITEAAAARGKQIARKAAVLLAQLIGNDLARLDSELEKLSLYVGHRPSITIEDVSAVVAATAGAAPYALTNAISAKQPGEALTALDKMLTRRGEEFRVLAIIRWQLRQAMGIPRRPWGRRDTAGRIGPSGLRRLLATDLSLKTGASPLGAMQLLVTDLCL